MSTTCEAEPAQLVGMMEFTSHYAEAVSGLGFLIVFLCALGLCAFGLFACFFCVFSGFALFLFCFVDVLFTSNLLTGLVFVHPCAS